MRLFVETPIPPELKNKLEDIGGEIKKDGINIVKPKNMHATLKFIGENSSEEVDNIKQKLADIRFNKFKCQIKGIGVFPNEKYIRVVWIGIESNGKLEELAKGVIDAMKIYRNDERFSAHITIARVKRKIDLKEFLDKYKNAGFGEFEVNKFNLMQSTLGKDGPKYTILASFKANE